jgi:N-acyl-phosphatidylethanolamine-hydrolysing phospholipase D
MRQLFQSAALFLVLAFPGLPFGFASEDFFAGAPRSEDGRFTNFAGDLGHGQFSDRFPFMLRRFGTYFRSGKNAPARVENDGVFLRENALHSVPTVTWIGHATLLVQIPIGPRRFVQPGMQMDDLPPIDFVVVSHNHYDHLDLPTLRALAERDPETTFYVPLGNLPLLRKNGINNVIELDWGQTADHEGVRIHCLPSQHWSKRSLTDTHRALWSSWAVTGDDRRFYFAGDTGYFNGFEAIGARLGPFDLVAVPIGAYAPRAMMSESHMNPEEALQAAIDLRANQIVAMHFGTFDLSDEPLAEPPKRFRDAASTADFGDDVAWILDIGETREF